MKLNIQLFASGESQWFEDLPLQMKMTWESTAGTSEQNYSTITTRIYGARGDSYTTKGKSWNGYLNVGGNYHSFSQIYTGTSTSVGGAWVLMAYYTDTIYHDSDGTKTITISGGLGGPSGTALSSKWCEGSFSATMDTIPRASQSTLNVSTATLGSTSITVTTNRQSSSFTHTIQTKINNNVIETFTSVTTSKTFTPSIANYAPYITSGSTAQLSIVTTTYSGNTQIGNPCTNTLTLSVPDNSSTKPTVSIGALSEGTTSVIPSGWNVYVQGKSKVSYTLSGSTKYSATISNYASYISGEVVYSGSSITSGVLKNAGTNTLTAQAQDSRGFWSAAATTTFDVVAYSAPIISEVKAERCDNNGTLADDGIYLKYTFKGSVSPVNNGSTDLNSKSYKLQYKEHTSSTWTDITIDNTSATNQYIIEKENITLQSPTFSYSTTYDIRFAITDSFTTTYSSVIALGTGKDLMNFNASGKSMAIGKVSEASSTDELLEIALDTEVDGKVEATGSLITTGNDTGVICDNQNATSPRKTKYTVSGGGRAGIYDMTNSSWIIQSETNQDVAIPHHFSTGAGTEVNLSDGYFYNGRNNDKYNIISAATESIYLRPNGRWSGTGQTALNPNGNLTVSGSITSNGKSVPVMKQLYSNTTGSTNVNIGEDTGNYNYYIISWGAGYGEKATDVFIPNFGSMRFTFSSTGAWYLVYNFSNSGNTISMAKHSTGGWGDVGRMYKIIGIKF